MPAELQSPGRAVGTRLVPWATLLILIAVTILGYFTVRAFNSAIDPELSNRSRLIGTIVRANIQRALNLGVPMDRLAGTESYLNDILKSFPEVYRITILTLDKSIVSRVERPKGRILFKKPSRNDTSTQGATIEVPAGAFTFPILSGNELVGEIIVEIDRTFIAHQFENIFLDVLVIILVAVLLAFEITITVTATFVSRPLDQLLTMLDHQAHGNFSMRLKQATTTSLDRVAARYSDHVEDLNNRFKHLLHRASSGQANEHLMDSLKNIGNRFGLSGKVISLVAVKDIIDIRLALFLFAFAEELSKPFLPLYTKAVLPGDPWLSQEILISLPIISYLLALAVVSPFMGLLTQKYTPKRIFLVALVPVAISHIGLSFSTSVTEIVLWRGISACGYAAATSACQAYALSAASEKTRTQGMASFVSVVMGGTFCGTAMGGVLADRLGPSNVFLVGAGMIGISAIIAYRMLSSEPPDRAPTGTTSKSVKDFFLAFGNFRFVTLLFGIAVPASILAAAFLGYLVPLLLSDLGSNPANIGRALMLYYLSIAAVSPWAARTAVNRSSTLAVVTLGGIISGLALIVLTRWYGFWPITLAIATIGAGHAMIRAPLIVITQEVANSVKSESFSGAWAGSLRIMFERLGSIVGLLLTAYLIDSIGVDATLGITGASVITGAILFAIVMYKQKT